MSSQATQVWLAALQARFGSVLRTPLTVERGVLRSDVTRYPAAAVADLKPGPKLTAAERLSVYQRQYWMRLLRVLQEQYPLVTRLCGAWSFNQYAMRILVAHPPRERDLGQVAEGFDSLLADALREDSLQPEPSGPALPHAALRQAAQLDAAFRRVFLAPEQPEFRPTPTDQATLPDRRLQLSAALARVEEHWPLLRLRSEIFGSTDEHAVPLPAALPTPQVWAVFRTPRGVGHVALDRESAELLALLEQRTLGEALAELETSCPEPALGTLPDRTQRFFAFAVQAGFFSAFR